MDGFSVSTIDLSMLSPETGLPLVANVYQVEGIDRQLSIGELVMAICLTRAAKLEEEIVTKMEDMSNVTTKLESLTKVQEKLVDFDSGVTINKFSCTTVVCEWPGRDSPIRVSDPSSLLEFLKVAGIKINGKDPDLNSSLADVNAAVSSAQDSLNSVNQKDMIELQSKTNKRDQSYDLITNMIKSIGTVLTATTNNFGG